MNRGDINRILERAWNDWWPNHLGQPLWVDDVGDGNLDPYRRADQAGRARVTEAFAVTIEHALAAEARGARGTDIDHRTFEAVMREAGHGPEILKLGGPIVGQLRIVNDSFADDTGVRCPSFLHAGNLFLEYIKDEQKALAVLNLAAETGYHGLRVWTTLRGTWWQARSGEVSPQVTPKYWSALRAFVQAAHERGLVLHLAAGDLAWFQGGQRADYHRGIAELRRDFPTTIALYEWANESRDTAGGLEPAQAERDVADIRALGGLVGLTSYTGHEDKAEFMRWTPKWLEFCIVHALRDGRWWDKIRHIFSLPYEDKTRRLWWHGEPWGVGPRVSASTSSSMAELDRKVYGLAAWQTAITGGVWCAFFSPGVILGDERFEDYPQFDIAPIMAARVEAFAREHSLQLGQLRLTHGGAGRPNVLTIASGGHDARIDQAIDDGKGVCLAVVYGPEGISAKSDGGYTWTWVNPETGELVENIDVTRTMRPGGLMGVRR